MTNDEIRSVLDALLDISPEAAERDELARAVSLNARLQAFSHYAMRCSRRGDQLAAGDRCEDGFATLLNEGGGSTRDAKAAGERDRACGTVPAFDEAFANGDVSAEHVDILARHTKDLTDEQRAEVAAATDELLAAAGGSSFTFERKLKALVATIKARTRPRSDAEQLERQRAASNVKRWTNKATGMKCTLIELDPLRDGQLHAVIDAKLAQLKQDPANAQLPFEQLKVAAVMESVTGQAGAMGVAEVNIHVDADTAAHGRHDHTMCETADGTPIPVSTMQRFCCDAIINAVVIEPDGSVRRLARMRTPNRAQRRALAAIYATCAHPDCTVPVTHCKVHHIVWYTNRGPTLLDNLVPLCETHHHQVHEGGWQIQMTPDRHITWTRPDNTVWQTHHSPNRHPQPPPPPANTAADGQPEGTLPHGQARRRQPAA